MVWRCEAEWAGETVFIIAGGTSVETQNLDLLRDRRVIVINSSVHTAPWASLLFFGDIRWYERVPENRQATEAFGGPVVTGSKFAPNVHGVIKKMNKVDPALLASDRCAVAYKKTSITAAINIAVHRGCCQIVLLGADGRAASDGRTHHHKPHIWAQRRGCWDVHKKELAAIAPQLQTLGIPVLNASPGSAWDIWPVMSLSEALQEIARCSFGECSESATTFTSAPSFAS